MTSPSAPTAPQVARRLADFLRREREGILRGWRERVEQLESARGLGPRAVMDHMPELLDRLIEQADPQGSGPDSREMAEVHALHRLDQGYDLEVVVREYATLRQYILERWIASEKGAEAIPVLHEVIDEAIAISMKRFTEVRQRLLLALDRISSAALKAAQLSGFLRSLIEVLLDVDPAIDSAAIHLVGDDGRLHLEAWAGPGAEEEERSRPLGEKVARAIASSREALELTDAAEHPRVGSDLLRRAGARALFGVPMLQDDRLIGVAHMSSTSAPRFATEDQLLFRSMVERAGAGVVKHQLRAALQEERRSLDLERRRLSTLLDLVPVGLLVVDTFGNLQAINRAFRRIWGEEAPVGIGPDRYHIYRAWWPDTRRQVAPDEWSSARALATGKEIGEELVEIENFSGERRIVLHSAAPFWDEQGQIAGAIVAIKDVTDSRRAERERAFLAEASRLLANSLEIRETLGQVAELVVPRFADWCAVDLVDPDSGRVEQLVLVHGDSEGLRLAEEALRRFPLEAGRGLGGQVLEQGLPLLLGELDEQRLRTLAMDDEHYALLQRMRLASAMALPMVAHGRMVGLLTLLSGESGRHFSGHDLRLASDLATRTAVAIENARLYASAQEAIRARDEMWAVASHELRNPLSVLRLQLKSAERQIQRDGEVPATALLPRLEVATRQVDRLIELTSELLDITRAQAGRFELRFEELDLGELVREVAESHADEALNASAPIELEVEEGLIGCWDRSRLHQVVTNLLSNAIKYGPDAPIAVRLRREGNEGVLEVEDRGIGIPPEDLERIFTPFERTQVSKRKQGVGLGLYIVRRIVEAHEGTIEARSRMGAGSTFIVRLPLDVGPCSKQAAEDRQRA